MTYKPLTSLIFAFTVLHVSGYRTWVLVVCGARVVCGLGVVWGDRVVLGNGVVCDVRVACGAWVEASENVSHIMIYYVFIF